MYFEVDNSNKPYDSDGCVFLFLGIVLASHINFWNKRIIDKAGGQWKVKLDLQSKRI